MTNIFLCPTVRPIWLSPSTCGSTSAKSPLVDCIAFLSLRQEIRSNAVTEEKQYGDCCGENGADGDDGADGADGACGADDGADGADRANGADGDDRAGGANGASGPDLDCADDRGLGGEGGQLH